VSGSPTLKASTRFGNGRASTSPTSTFTRFARDGDTNVVTNLDRLGCNLHECLNVIHDLRQ
jgi:DNA invertase Pin-like site-specific DNA recombinase